MRKRKIESAIRLAAAAALLAGTSTSALAAVRIFSASSGNLSADATFTTTGNTLTVWLRNVSTADVMNPAEVLTALFWSDVGSSANVSFTRVSALLDPYPGTTVTYGPDGGGNVGGEWAYDTAVVLPSLAVSVRGVSSAGFGPFGPEDRFDTSLTADLQPPESPDGLQYGITSANDNLATGNAAVTGNNALIKNSVLLTFTTSGEYDLNYIRNVSFQYGTSLTFEPNVPDPRSVPEPSTVIAGALLLLPFGASTLRMMRKRQAA